MASDKDLDEIVIIRRDPDSGWLPGFLLGAAVGAVAGLLRAPKPGKQIRESLLSRGKSVKDIAVSRATSIKDTAQSKLPNRSQPTVETSAVQTEGSEEIVIRPHS